MLSILWSFVAFIVALGVLITVHEFGHFWVARRCGVRVERFSIGFGKALWQRRDRQGTEYVIALIPLGGYVKMLDERVESVPAELRHQAFNNKTIWQRASIIAAGPVANFIFAIFAYWVVFIHGVPGVRPVVGEIVNGSVAAEAQIASGMELKAVDGIETPDWDAVRMALIGKIGDAHTVLTVSRFGEEATQQKMSTCVTGSLSQTKRIRLLRWAYVRVVRKSKPRWRRFRQSRLRALPVCKRATGSLKSMVSR